MPDHRVLWFDELTNEDVPIVGGKNASLGEMIQRLKEAKIRVPDGFATTSTAYREFLAENQLEEPIRGWMERFEAGDASLEEAGHAVRELIGGGRFSDGLADAIAAAYRELSARYGDEATDVAVRSSATAEDLPEASFAGQQESFLNVRGVEALLEACRRCYASLFTDRAISYRQQHGFDPMQVALSIGVQKMVRADRGGAGVLFTLDTETGFPDVVGIDAAWGLGESVVQGTVEPDAYQVFKPLLADEDLAPIVSKVAGAKELKVVACDGGTEEVETSPAERRAFVLSDPEVLALARWGCAIEAHYERPMDVEWAKDGDSGELFVVQARPETVQARKLAGVLKTATLKERGEEVVSGLAVGGGIAAGKAFVLHRLDEAHTFEDGGVLVTDKTDPDWGPLMRRASAIVTDHGGRTSHAAIVSRELGIPAIVGAGDATRTLETGREVTVSCAEGERGRVYAGVLAYEEREVDLSDLPPTTTRVMLNLADPDAAFRWWSLPADGVGLARLEFLINDLIQVHPMALLRYDALAPEVQAEIDRITGGRADRDEYYVETLARGISKIAAALYPRPVVVRFSDFKSNEYAQLVGGRGFEPREENPMLGFRGASRYTSPRFRDAFALECRALRRAREQIGLDNVVAMVPFCRTLEEADGVLEAMSDEGLERGRDGFRVYVMAEIPSNVVLAREFAARFDGFSIGSNDLTQLVLGVDRDSDLLADLFDERNEAVTRTIRHLIEEAHAAGVEVGLCGQAPSDHPDFARFLVACGIDSVSVDPASLVDVRHEVAAAEAARERPPARQRRSPYRAAGMAEPGAQPRPPGARG